MSLRKKDLQDFFKRLRKSTKVKSIKYYAVGEYGSDTMRPHYHAIIFDAHPDDILAAWQYVDGTSVVRGHCHFDQVNNNTIAYTAKYMAKSGKIPLFARDDRIPEFSLMSKRLGANYLTPEIVKYHKESFRSYLTMEGGATHAMPRYYRDQIFTEEDRKHMSIGLSDKFDLKFEEAVKEAGSVEELYRRQHWAVRVANNEFNNSKKRNKI